MTDLLYNKSIEVANDLFTILTKMATDKQYYTEEQREELFSIRKQVGESLINLNNLFETKSHSDCVYYDEGEFNEYCGMTGMQICDDEICEEFKDGT